MKVRQKIALIFTILTSIVLFSAFAFIYYLSSNYKERDFYSRLQEKATLTAWKYFEEDEMTKPAYGLVIERYIRSLPDSHEIVLNAADSIKTDDSLQRVIPDDLKRVLLSRNMIKFRRGNSQWVGLYYPDNQGNFIILINAVDSYGILKQRNLLKSLIIIFLGSLVFIYLVGQVYAQRVLAPIVNITRNVRNISATNLSMRLEERPGNDELTELTRMFNQMLERLEDSFTLQRNFIHNASHELKNPITAIMGETEVALNRQRNVAEYIETLKVIMGETERLEQLTRNLLALAQADIDLSSMTLQEIRLDGLLIEIKESFDKTLYKDRIRLHISEALSETGFRMLGISNLMYIAISNVIDNACKFSGNQVVEVVLNENRSGIQLNIKDKGIGVPEKEMKDLFQPFFRATNALSHKGSGIGLSLVKKIISLHRGRIEIVSKTGIGTSIEIYLPHMAD